MTYTNLVRGKGFNSNDKVLENFIYGRYDKDWSDDIGTGGANWYNAALKYFGFKGTYDPNNPLFKKVGPAANALTDPETGEIFYRHSAFKNYDFLHLVADHEMVHHLQVKSGGVEFHQGEWEASMRDYKNQGLYPDYEPKYGIVTNIRYHGMNSGHYFTDARPNLNFVPKWWHFIYKIPRRW